MSYIYTVSDAHGIKSVGPIVASCSEVRLLAESAYQRNESSLASVRQNGAYRPPWPVKSDREGRTM